MCSLKRSWSGPQRVCCTFQGFAPWWPVLALTFFLSGLQTILSGCATRPEDYWRLMSVCAPPSAFSKKLELIQLIVVCRVTWPRRNMPQLCLILGINDSLVLQGCRSSHFRRCPETTVMLINVILLQQVRLGPLCNSVSMAIRYLTFYLNYQSRMTLQSMRGRLDPKISCQEPTLSP